ncbi:MAG TPA: hypothetical protein VIK51_24635, partial [Vicinamibacteria bacterium]
MTPLISADTWRRLRGAAAVKVSLLAAGAGARVRAALSRVRPLLGQRGFRVAAVAGAVLLGGAAFAHHLYLDRSGLPDLEPFIRFEPPTIGEVSDA